MPSEFISENPVSTTRSVGQPGNCHNRLGKNQYKDRPLPNDPEVAAALKAYHLKGINDSVEISRLLLEEHGIMLCGSSVKRRRQKLGLLASRATTSQMSEADKRQLIVQEMAKDPKGKSGPQMIKQRIFQETGIHLSRAYIREEMRKLDPESYAKRGPRHAKLKRQERLAREAQTAASSIASNRSPPAETRRQQDLATRFLVHVCDSGLSGLSQEPVENDIESISENEYGESLQEPQEPSSESTASAARSSLQNLLENAIPTMTALTRFLSDASFMSDLEFDQPTYELFNRGVESAALLEQQLSRVISGRDM